MVERSRLALVNLESGPAIDPLHGFSTSKYSISRVVYCIRLVGPDDSAQNVSARGPVRFSATLQPIVDRLDATQELACVLHSRENKIFQIVLHEIRFMLTAESIEACV